MGNSSVSQPDWAGFARQVIEHAVRNQADDRATVPEHDPRPYGGAFVTLRKLGRLRGCMGTLEGTQPIDQSIRRAAISAALSDPRFSPVSAAELPDLRIEVSIMSTPEPMGSIEELEIGKHGIIVRQGSRRGLFLPQVAVDHKLDKEAFLSRCCAEKAGLASDAWRNADTEVLLFASAVFAEPQS